MRSGGVVRMLAAAAVGITSSAMAAPTLYRDFQADPVGGLPLSADANTLLKFNVERLEVVDASSNPSDPFGNGSDGNHSLLAENLQTNSHVYFAMIGTAPGISAGVFSTKFYHSPMPGGVEGSNYPLTRFEIGAFSTYVPSNSDVGIDLGIDGDSRMLMFYNSGQMDFDQYVTYNAVHTIALNFDCTTDTFTGTLDGNPLTANGGLVTSFSFVNPQASMYAVEFGTPTGSRTGRAFIDNVTIDAVPEPASLSLMLGLGCIAFYRRR